MLRHYYILDSLDEVEVIEHELQSYGISQPNIHTLTNDDKSLEKHHLHNVNNSLEQGLIKSENIGALIGVILSFAILLIGYILNWHNGSLGGMPIIFFALLVLALCTWEGEHLDVQLPHINTKLFKKSLDSGKIILFIDVEQQQELTINKIMVSHPSLKPEGIATSTPEWFIRQQKNLRRLLK